SSEDRVQKTESPPDPASTPESTPTIVGYHWVESGPISKHKGRPCQVNRNMFENLTEQLSHSLRVISGKAKLSEENIQESLRDVRRALLEADVALPVVKDFIDSVK